VSENTLTVLNALDLHNEPPGLHEKAFRDWHNDQNTGRPDQVWARIEPEQRANVAAILRPPDFIVSDRYWVWRCDSADHRRLMCKLLISFPRTSFWAIGKPYV
jgi:hypothetical protein